MTIACGTDLSPQAAQAADAAAAIAAALGTPLDLVYVADGFWRELPERARGPLVDEVRGRLRAEAERLGRRGVTVRDHLLYGVADEALTAHAGQAGARLLVVSSTGRRAPARWVLGSVAERTVQTSDLGDRAVPFAYGLLPQGGIVHLLHVVEMAEVNDLAYRHYETGFPPTDAQRAAQEPELCAHLQALVPAGAAARGVETHVRIVEARSAGAAIVTAAERLGADLICVGSHGRSGLSAAFAGSVAQDVVARSGRPVVVVGPGPD
jgi:nucleotide-binding universal stress UspA family protein